MGVHLVQLVVASIMTVLAPAIFVAVLILIVVGIVYAHQKEQARRQALLKFARRQGWTFRATDDPSHDDRYRHFEIFRRGDSRAAFNTLTGVLEVGEFPCPLHAGDYKYTESSGSGDSQSTTTYRISFCILHLPWPHTPDVLIRGEHGLDKFAAFLGFEDIDFESAEFSDRFHVSGNDKRFAYDLIDARMMEFLLAGGPPVTDMQRGQICLTSRGRRWEPAEFEQHAAWLWEFLSRWPRHIIADLEAQKRA